MDMERERLQSFLLGDPELPDPALLRRQALAAWAYTRVPSNHPRRAELRGDFLQLLDRHHRIKCELIPLVAAWRRAGIDVSARRS